MRITDGELFKDDPVTLWRVLLKWKNTEYYSQENNVLWTFISAELISTEYENE